MSKLLRHTLKSNPSWIIGTLWPVVLLAPFVPGLPRPEPSGLAWRQELLLALLLSWTAAQLFKRARLQLAAGGLFVSRRELLLVSPLALFLLWSALSLAWASNPYPVLHYTLVWAAYLLFFLFMLAVAARARLLALSLSAFVAVILIISLASVAGSLGAPISLFRYNGLGEPLAVSVPLIAALALSVRRRKLAIICVITTLLAWLAVLQTFERAPFLSTGAGLILFALLALCFPKFRRISPLRAGLLACCFILVTIFQFMPETFSVSGVRPPHTTLSRLQTTSAEDENTRARFLFWGVALEMWRERPLTGAGANHYGIAFPEARARFAAARPDSKLAALNEGHLTIVAHNEYLQMLAELGLVGLLLFTLFAAGLVWAAWLALRRAESLLVPGAVSALAVFALNSGASSISFRWLGSGLIFFFAAALCVRFAQPGAQAERKQGLCVPQLFVQRASLCALSFSLLMFCAMSMQAVNIIQHGRAQGSPEASVGDGLYRSALFWNPFDGATHFNYGIRLFHQQRYGEAIEHLRFGLANGMNTSVCYAYLASAEMKAGESVAGEATLAEGLRVYPRSIFLRVRLASALFKTGRESEAQSEMERAYSIDEVYARGWWELINSGKTGAVEAARRSPGKIAIPGSLSPVDGVFLVMSENGERPPSLDITGDGQVTASQRH